MNIIINGGTSGIGKELALLFARDINNHILITGRNESNLKQLADENKNIDYFKIDLAVFDSMAGSFRDKVLKQFKSVDILINMAGLLINKDFLNSTIDDARLTMETNFFGPASVIKVLKPVMARGSHIVNIASMGGFQGSSKYVGLSYYSASKAALAVLSECLAGEFSNDGISVNCLALGAVQTQMLEEAFPGYKAPVEAKEMAEFIADFALKGNKYFNGKILPVAVNNP